MVEVMRSHTDNDHAVGLFAAEARLWEVVWQIVHGGAEIKWIWSDRPSVSLQAAAVGGSGDGNQSVPVKGKESTPPPRMRRRAIYFQ